MLRFDINKNYRNSVIDPFTDCVGNTFIAPFPEVKILFFSIPYLQKIYLLNF